MRVLQLIVLLLSPAVALGASSTITMSVESKTVYAPSYLEEKAHINKLDSMDVLSLSKSAPLLYYGHMFDLKGYQRLLAHQSRLNDLKPFITQASNKTGLEPSLIAAVILVESGAVAQALSPKGAQGLMQLMPQTQKELDLHDPFDPQDNIMAGARYLARMLNQFNNNQSLALAAYNSGPGSVNKHNGIPPFKETQEFVLKVHSAQAHLQAQGWQ